MNANSIKPLVIDKSLTSYSAWDDANKELRSVLSNGDMLYVKYWACEHYGLNAQLLIPTFEWNAASLEKRISWLSSQVLSKRDVALLDAALKKHGQIQPNDKIEIEGTNYDEFNLEINSVNNLTIITIEYYYG